MCRIKYTCDSRTEFSAANYTLLFKNLNFITIYIDNSHAESATKVSPIASGFVFLSTAKMYTWFCTRAGYNNTMICRYLSHND